MGDESRKIRQLEAVAELGLAAVGLDETELAQRIVGTASEVLDVEMAKVLELLPQGDGLHILAGVGWDAGLVGNPDVFVPTGRDSQAGFTLSSREPVVVEDLTTETRFTGPRLLLDHRVRSGISVNVAAPGGGARPWGVLGIHSRQPATFSQDDVAFVQALANLMSAKVGEASARRAQAEAESRSNQSRRLEAIGTLAGGIAHDFNNILTVITACTDLALRACEDDSSVARDLRTIQEVSQRAAGLTGQILAFGRKQVLQPRATDINAVVEGILRLLRRTFEENITLAFERGTDIGTIFVDPIQLEQVLMNLCINARDAMPEGGRLSVRTEWVVVGSEGEELEAWAEPGRYARLTVTDTGTGMAREELERVFEPFYTTKEVGRGSGLGLATVYGIIRQHKGMVRCSSEPGSGSSFEIYLPVVARPVQKATTAPAIRDAGGDETILLAEDEPLVRAVATRILEEAGYEVRVASDGQAAVEAFEADHDSIDLVVLDVVMPGLGGRKALARMRESASNLRFLLVSGYNDDRDDLAADERQAWVSKPYDADMLLSRVRQALDA